MRYRLPLLILLLLVPLPASSAEPLVDVAWLKAGLGKPGLVVLDLRPTRALYAAGHIPGAVYSDYAKDGWREKNAAGIEGMLPPPEKVERLVGSLGIDNATHIILVPEGRSAQDMGNATRVYWTFKVMGHDNVSILNGGFLAWVAEIDQAKKPVNPLETTEVKPAPKVFKASVRQEMLIGKADVQKAMAEKQPLIDNRPQDFFVGLSKSPAAKAAGTIPGARSIPDAWLTQNNGGTFRSKAQLEKLYAVAGVPTTGRQVNFCNTGHWASLGWFVASEIIGNKQAQVYDGSMAEWTHDPSLPVERKITTE